MKSNDITEQKPSDADACDKLRTIIDMARHRGGEIRRSAARLQEKITNRPLGVCSGENECPERAITLHTLLDDLEQTLREDYGDTEVSLQIAHQAFGEPDPTPVKACSPAQIHPDEVPRALGKSRR